MSPDLTCYLVLDERLCGADGLAGTARAAVAGGAGAVQLRLKDATTERRVAVGREVALAIAGSGAAFIVNDDIEAALELGADGLHVGQQDIDPAEARARIGRGMLLGLSVETEEQAMAVDPDLVDHVGAGPVRATDTKPGHADPLGWEGLARVISAAPVPAVAIGGVKAQDAQQAVAAGAVGLAVVSAICGRPDPEAAARQIVAEMKRAREVMA